MLNITKSKKILTFFIVIVIMIMSLPIFSAFEAHIVNVTATIDNPVLLNYPNGGEIFSIGECHIIEWTVDERLPRPGDINSIDLYYSTDGGVTYPEKNKITTISSGINDGNVNTYCFDWLVPNNPTDQAKIMALIDYTDPEIPNQVDYSDENFDIAYTSDGNTVALWHFNEGSGSTASDETTNNNGTLMPDYFSSNSPTWTNGRYKNALEFDGDDDYVKVSDSNSLDITDEITIEAWIKADIWENPDAPIDVRNILDKGEHNSGKAYGLYSYNGKLHFRINKTSAADVSSDLPSLEEWHHIAGTYDGVKIKLYIDNVMTAEKNYSENISINDEPLYIGGGVNRDYYFNGIIDEVRISKIARDFNIICEQDEGDPLPVPPEEGDVVINEIMWMGSSIDKNDEWIELRNITDKNIDLSNCNITKWVSGSHEDLMIVIPSGNIIQKNGYFLISNFDAGNSQINIISDLVDEDVALNNNNLQIKLYNGTWNAEGILIDTADDGGSTPLTGSYTSGSVWKSMLRKSTPGDGTSAGDWCTATTSINWDSGATELGTPGVVNSSCN